MSEQSTSEATPKQRTKKRRAKKKVAPSRELPPVTPSTLGGSSWLSKSVIVALVIGVLAGGAGGFYAGQRYRPSRAQGPEPGPAYIALAAWSPRKGPEHAKVTIVEFSDLQCPFCARVNPTLQQIEKTYGDDVAIVFRHKPLPMHKDARSAALAMQAAARQGKAWEMHDKMFADRADLSQPTVEKFAGELGLDVTKFKADYEDPKLGEEVDADSKAADEAGARGTPTFFINGRRIRGARPFGDFKKVIDEEIEKANALVAKGTAIAQIYDALAKNQKSN